MERDAKLKRIFTRRVALLAAGKAVLVSTLIGRLHYLQVVEADQYVLLAEANRINHVLLPPRRGLILDRRGRVLADNRQIYRVGLVPEQTPSLDRTLAALTRHLPAALAPDDKRIAQSAARRPGYLPIMIADDLSWEQFARLNLMLPELPGVFTDVAELRWYPHGRAFAHAVGYVAAVAEEETGHDPLMKLSEFRIGKSGIEQLAETALRGRAGSRRIEVNAFGRPVRELARSRPQHGRDVVSTLDLDLQAFARERFGQEAGAAVTLDVHSGDVLAMLSVPSFDPNPFVSGFAARDWRALSHDERKPLLNRAITGVYPPGSTFKVVVALAALEGKLVGPDFQVTCGGRLTLGSHDFHCWKRGGHGTLDMVGAIRSSCDIYFYEVARRLGTDRIAEMARRCGLGVRPGLDLPGEKDGLVPTRAWKRRALRADWSVGETLINGIGQGYVLATPLQLATLAARVANGGYAVKPRLLRPQAGDDGGGAMSIGISEPSLMVVRRGMERVVNDPRGGTAYRSRIADPASAMAGKTGTSQVRRITRVERLTRVKRQNELPWLERDHALFIGYAPIDAPRYAVAVVVEHGGSGSAVAAPIARDILIRVQRLGRRTDGDRDA